MENKLGYAVVDLGWIWLDCKLGCSLTGPKSAASMVCHCYVNFVGYKILQNTTFFYNFFYSPTEAFIHFVCLSIEKPFKAKNCVVAIMSCCNNFVWG